MTIFVLVHGASHGSWCWDKVVPLLEMKGHEALAVDLPGNTYGEFDIPLGQVNLGSYTDHVCKVLDQIDEPVVLVGHSLGGLTITQSAEYRPENVLAMLYRHLGIDPVTTFNDVSGRPRYLLEERELIHELI